MKRLLPIFVALAMASTFRLAHAEQAFAQAIEESELYAQYIFQVANNSTQTVFVDQTNVRSKPNIHSPAIDSLDIGQQVTIIQEESVLKLGERSANWYKISYTKNNEEYTGYIWGANLSVGYRHINGYDFLFGIAPNTNKKSRKLKLIGNDYEYEYNADMVIKVLKNTLQGDQSIQKMQLIQSVHFQAPPSSLSSVAFRWGDKTGLDGVEKLLIAEVSGEACGIPTVTKYMLWTDDKLVALPMLNSMSDGGIFYHSEDYLFPTDEEGKAGKIILNVEEGEEGEEQADGTQTPSHESTKKTSYLWKDIKATLTITQGQE